MGSQLPPLEKSEFVKFLEANLDVFTWSTYVPGINPRFICHQLNVNPWALPRKQPPRRSSKDHAEAVRIEVKKLKQAGAIKEIFYPKWLANTVVVKKKSGKWQVCMDFTNEIYFAKKTPSPFLELISWWMP